VTVAEETQGRILDKVEYIEGVVERLSQKQDIEREEYLNDWEQQAVVERTFQTAIEACLDIRNCFSRNSMRRSLPPMSRNFHASGIAEYLIPT